VTGATGPLGPAGGDLGGTYPNPDVKEITGNVAGAVPITSPIAIGASPAATGDVRLGNTGSVKGHDIAGGGGDVTLVSFDDSGPTTTFGDQATFGVLGPLAGATTTSGFVIVDTNGQMDVVVLDGLVSPTPGQVLTGNGSSHAEWGAGGGGSTGATGATGATGSAGSAVGGNGFGLFSARGATGATGATWVSSDGGTQFVYSGAAWRPLIDGTPGTQPPAAVNWTSIATGSTIADSAGALYIGGTTSVALQGETIPRVGATGDPYTLTACLKIMPYLDGVSGQDFYGIGFTDGTKYVLFGLEFNLSGVCTIGVWTYATAASQPSNVTFTPWFHAPSANVILQIKNDGSNRSYAVSYDGVHFDDLVLVQANTTFINNNENKFALMLETESNTDHFLCRSWLQTDP
jgi:hypothetical protein